jgi:hypothetical protein
VGGPGVRGISFDLGLEIRGGDEERRWGSDSIPTRYPHREL